MRIDKLINFITQNIFSGKHVYGVLEGKVPLSIRYFSKLITIKKKILLYNKGPWKGIKNREGYSAYNISQKSFNPAKRLDGISAIARLKNGDDFLEKCILSILDSVDEVILLVDTNGVDQTNQICKKLASLYPKKIKHYEYIHEVYPGNHPKYSNTPDDSVHALSYFYNYCLSKSTYKYVMKFDDDMLATKNFSQLCTQIKLSKPLQKFVAIPQVNVMKKGENIFGIPIKYLHSGIAGLFGDHGIFPISYSTYFFNDHGCENLIMPYNIQYKKIAFLHLKNLKSDKGSANYQGYALEYMSNLTSNSDYIDLPKKYLKILENISE